MAEPMGEKEVSCRHLHKKETISDEYFHQVTDLAGIGDVLGKRLSGKGFDKVKIGNGDKSSKGCLIDLRVKLVQTMIIKAYVVLGQFLLLKKNKDLFVEWIKVQRIIHGHNVNIWC